MSLLSVDGWRCGYGANEVIHGIDFHIAQGEVVTILGPNGCGKTTFVKSVLGYLPPTAGRILFAGRDIAALTPAQRAAAGIGYVPQLLNVFKPLTVEENLEMGGYALAAAARKQALERNYSFFPALAARRRQGAATLSGGERQMLAMARAMMMAPKLLFLDEPSAGLSPLRADEVFEQVRTITALGTSAAIVEQDAYRALRVSARGYVLVTGKVAFEGAASEILADERIRLAYLGGRAPSPP